MKTWLEYLYAGRRTMIWVGLSLLSLFALLTACSVSTAIPFVFIFIPQIEKEDIYERPNNMSGAEGNPEVFAIGGGPGYNHWVNQGGATLVSTKDELLNALKKAHEHDVIYVDDQATIDLTGEQNIRINAGVTLASGRGRNGSMGALIKTATDKTDFLFVIRAGGVRITGLRLQGPSPVFIPGGCPDNARGILIRTDLPPSKTPGVEIDNNEIWAWPGAAITIQTTPDVHVEHNYIHDNTREVMTIAEDRVHGCDQIKHSYGLGYGVNISGTLAYVDANFFDYNRHDITSYGSPGSGYIARYNLIGSHGYRQSFDMHGFGEQDPDATYHPYVAGDIMAIHHNEFMNPNQCAIVIRGKPATGAFIYRNQFAQSDKTILQRNVTPWKSVDLHIPDTENLFVTNNQFNVVSPASDCPPLEK